MAACRPAWLTSGPCAGYITTSDAQGCSMAALPWQGCIDLLVVSARGVALPLAYKPAGIIRMKKAVHDACHSQRSLAAGLPRCLHEILLSLHVGICEPSRGGGGAESRLHGMRW